MSATCDKRHFTLTAAITQTPRSFDLLRHNNNTTSSRQLTPRSHVHNANNLCAALAGKYRNETMAFLAKLQEISPAYAAYATLKCPPKNCPLFESPDGYPILEPGEIFCRLDGVEGRVCGAKEETTDHLLYHMEAEHEAMRMDRPMEPRRKAEVGELERVDRTCGVKDVEEYEF